MYFKESEHLQREAPELQSTIDAVDRFIAAHAQEQWTVTASYVATRVDQELRAVRSVLLRFKDKGLLTMFFVSVCPIHEGRIQRYETRESIPVRIECDLCDDVHERQDDGFIYVVFSPTERVAERQGDACPFESEEGSAPSPSCGTFDKDDSLASYVKAGLVSEGTSVENELSKSSLSNHRIADSHGFWLKAVAVFVCSVLLFAGFVILPVVKVGFVPYFLHTTLLVGLISTALYVFLRARFRYKYWYAAAAALGSITAANSIPVFDIRIETYETLLVLFKTKGPGWEFNVPMLLGVVVLAVGDLVERGKFQGLFNLSGVSSDSIAAVAIVALIVIAFLTFLGGFVVILLAFHSTTTGSGAISNRAVEGTSGSYHQISHEPVEEIEFRLSQFDTVIKKAQEAVDKFSEAEEADWKQGEDIPVIGRMYATADLVKAAFVWSGFEPNGTVKVKETADKIAGSWYNVNQLPKGRAFRYEKYSEKDLMALLREAGVEKGDLSKAEGTLRDLATVVKGSEPYLVERERWKNYYHNRKTLNPPSKKEFEPAERAIKRWLAEIKELTDEIRGREAVSRLLAK